MDDFTRGVLRWAGGCLTAFLLFSLCIAGYILGYQPYSAMCEIESQANNGVLGMQMFLSEYYAGRRNDYIMLYHGRFMPDKRKSIHWMQTAAKTAAFQYPGEDEREFPEIPNSQFMKWYEEAAHQGNSKAAKRLYDIYAYGQFGQPRDPKKAAYWRRFGR